MYIRITESLNYICKNTCKNKWQTGKTVSTQTHIQMYNCPGFSNSYFWYYN